LERSPIDGERRKSGAVVSRVVRFPRFVIKLNPGPAAGIGPRGLPQNPHVVHGGYRCSTYSARGARPHQSQSAHSGRSQCCGMRRPCCGKWAVAVAMVARAAVAHTAAPCSRKCIRCPTRIALWANSSTPGPLSEVIGSLYWIPGETIWSRAGPPAESPAGSLRVIRIQYAISSATATCASSSSASPITRSILSRSSCPGMSHRCWPIRKNSPLNQASQSRRPEAVAYRHLKLANDSQEHRAGTIGQPVSPRRSTK
jgi:hypothetical protein